MSIIAECEDIGHAQVQGSLLIGPIVVILAFKPINRDCVFRQRMYLCVSQLFPAWYLKSGDTYVRYITRIFLET